MLSTFMHSTWGRGHVNVIWTPGRNFDWHQNLYFFIIRRTVFVAAVCPCIRTRSFVCIRNCVSEFGTDTGQPLVTSNVV